MTTINTANDCTVDQAKRDAFAHKFMKAVKLNGIRHSMSYDKDAFSVVLDTPSVRTTQNLRNIFVEYHAVYGKARDRVLKDYVRGFKETSTINKLRNTPFTEARERLRPLLRSRILTDNERYEFEGDDPSQFKPTPLQPFSADANILLGYDLGRSIMKIEQSRLEYWGVTFTEAMSIAMKNLTKMSRPRFTQISSGVLAGAWNDYFDSSRLLTPDLFSGCRDISDPVIMIPTAERIYVTDKSNKHGLLKMLHGVENIVSNSLKIISTQMYHFMDGKPTQYEPEDDQVLLRLDKLRKPLFQRYAHQQKKIVEAYLIRIGNWAYIMSLMIAQSKDGRSIGTISTWMDDQETIFPEADIIAVSKTERTADGYAVRNDPVLLWPDVIGKYGHLVQKLDGFPNLYRAAPFSGNNSVPAEAT